MSTAHGDPEFPASSLATILSQEPWREGEDRLVYRWNEWVLKVERIDYDAMGSNVAEAENITRLRGVRLPHDMHVPECRLVPLPSLTRDEPSFRGSRTAPVLAVRYVDGIPLRACARLDDAECPNHPHRCLSLARMREIHSLTGLYDFALGNVLAASDGLHLVDLTLCDYDQDLDAYFPNG